MAEPSKDTKENKEAKETKVTVDLEKTPATTRRSGALARFDDIEQEVERLFEQFVARDWRRPFRDFPTLRTLESARLPKVDLVERDHEIAVRAELPGFDRKDINVSLTEKSITIHATSRKETKEEKGEFYRREISTGEISRTLALPSEVDGTKATAEFKDGLLEIVVPKIAKATRVEVNVK